MLLNQCFSFYKTHGYELQNGVPCSEEGVKSMLLGIRNVLAENLRGHNGEPPQIPDIVSLQRSKDDAFDAGNFADIIAVIFEVVVEDNGDPMLWKKAGGAGWQGAVNHAFSVFFSGPLGAAISSPGDGVRETTFAAAKAKLQLFLHQSRNLFDF